MFKQLKKNMTKILQRNKSNIRQTIAPSNFMLVFWIYDLWFMFRMDHHRDHTDYIADIRTINQYCNYYLVFISVIIGFLLTLPVRKKSETINIPVAVFGVSLISASLNLIFFPVPYYDSNWIKYLWILHIMCGQAVVIFTVFGLIRLLKSYMERHPISEISSSTDATKYAENSSDKSILD